MRKIIMIMCMMSVLSFQSFAASIANVKMALQQLSEINDRGLSAQDAQKLRSAKEILANIPVCTVETNIGAQFEINNMVIERFAFTDGAVKSYYSYVLDGKCLAGGIH